MNKIFFINPRSLLLLIVCTIGAAPLIAMQESSKLAGGVAKPNSAPITGSERSTGIPLPDRERPSRSKPPSTAV